MNNQKIEVLSNIFATGADFEFVTGFFIRVSSCIRIKNNYELYEFSGLIYTTRIKPVATLPEVIEKFYDFVENERITKLAFDVQHLTGRLTTNFELHIFKNEN